MIFIYKKIDAFKKTFCKFKNIKCSISNIFYNLYSEYYLYY